MCPVLYDRGKGLVADQKGEYHRVTCIVSGTESRYLPYSKYIVSRLILHKASLKKSANFQSALIVVTYTSISYGRITLPHAGSLDCIWIKKKLAYRSWKIASPLPCRKSTFPIAERANNPVPIKYHSHPTPEANSGNSQIVSIYIA